MTDGTEASAGPTDAELLGQYLGAGSQAAFGALVARHHGMVYRSCLRQLGGATGLAEDAAQAVFILLARKARGLRNAGGVARWLFRTAGFVVGHIKREEARRRKREEESAAMSELLRQSRDEVSWWTGMGEQVYAALGRLGAPYQEALILHCLEGLSQRDVAHRLGCSEAAVNKRVTRGLAKLKRQLSRRGVAVSVAVLTAHLAAESAQAATAGLAETCQAVALAGAAGSAAAAGAAAHLADAAARAMMWLKVKTAVAVACSATAVVTGGATAVRMALPDAPVTGFTDGIDYALPADVPVTPQSGYIANDADWRQTRAAQPHYADGGLHFAASVRAAWKELNPAEDVYDWSELDRQIERAVSVPGSGFVLWVLTYAEFRRTHGDTPSVVPAWVLDATGARVLSNGTVAAWDPGCRCQEYLGRFLRALGARYKDHPNLVGVSVNGFCVPNDSIRLFVSEEDLLEAERQAELTPERFRLWAGRFLQDWLEAFAGQERKLTWATGGSAPMPSGRYEFVTRELWRRAYEAGCGGRVEFSGAWLSRLDPSHGMRLNREGHVVFDEAFRPVRAGALWQGAHDGGFGGRPPRFGSDDADWLSWWGVNLWILRARCNWVSVPGNRMAAFVARDPAFARWMDLSLGKTAETSPDAWCWLREGYVPGPRGSDGPVKNFERWLEQRDVAPDGRTVPAERVDIAELGQWASARDYEFHARRTDLAGGSPCIYFRVDPAFATAGVNGWALKVTYLDGAATEWVVEFGGAHRLRRSAPVRTLGSGAWKTVTFAMPPDLRFDGALAGGMDWRLRVAGPNDLTVKFVRLVKGAPPAQIAERGAERPHS